MLYIYKGKSNSKDVAFGEIEASSRLAAIKKIKNDKDISVILYLSLKKETPVFEKIKLTTEKKIKINKSKPNKSKPKKRLSKKESESIYQILNKINDSNIDINKNDSPGVSIFVNQEPRSESGELVQEYISTEKPKFVEKKKQYVEERSLRYENTEIPEEEKMNVKIPYTQIKIFTERLAILLSSGVSLSQALLTLRNNQNKKMRMVINHVYEDIQSGSAFSHALSRFPNQFSRLYIAMVQIGETTGTLPLCLKDITQFFDVKNKISKKIKGAMIYPSIILFVVALMLVLGSKFFIPMFSDLFLDLDVELPMLTKVVFVIAGKMYLVVGVPVVLFILFKLLALKSKTVRGINKKIKDRVCLTIPVVSSFVETTSMFYFSHTLALMLKNGIRLLDSLSLSQEVIVNDVINHEIANAKNLIIEGASLSEALMVQPHFEALLAEIISTGEESGKMHFTLCEAADYYKEKVEYKTVLITEFIQPISILLVALIVIPVLFAIFIPLMDLSTGKGVV